METVYVAVFFSAVLTHPFRPARYLRAGIHRLSHRQSVRCIPVKSNTAHA
ncbi:hypothetical protein X963_4763 [Burkholderia pseudomallei MSHR7498]|nr:hypothetical protein X963_4763 [Burkholderia pseudomallei MSHR7498]KOT16818.1 hypothetical protein DM47_2010 [Burkholderia mallei]